MTRFTDTIANRFREFRDDFKVSFTKKRCIVESSYVDSSVQVLGWKNVRIGKNTIVSEDTWINVNHREIADVSIHIGDHCFIGRRNFFTTGELIKIGNYCLTGVGCNFLGSDHIYTSPFVPYITTGTTGDGMIEIGPNCWLGADATVLKGVKVGYGSIIGAATVVNRDIPPLSVVVGNPCRVSKRFDMQLQDWVREQDYPEDGDRNLPSESEYLKILEKSQFDMKELLVASSKSLGDL